MPQALAFIGRSSVIRTRDPLLPKQVRYQAALYSVKNRGDRVCGAGLPWRHVAIGRFIAMLPAAYKRFNTRFSLPFQGMLRSATKPCTNRASWGVAKW